MLASPPGNRIRGIYCVVAAMVAMSTQDMVIKWISGTYLLHDIVLARTLVAILLTLFIVSHEGGFVLLRTRRFPLHLLRGLLIVIANSRGDRCGAVRIRRNADGCVLGGSPVGRLAGNDGLHRHRLDCRQQFIRFHCRKIPGSNGKRAQSVNPQMRNAYKEFIWVTGKMSESGHRTKPLTR